MFKVHEKGAQGGPGEQARGSNEEAVSSEVESERLKLASQVMNSIKNKLRIFDESDILSDNKVEKREVGYVKKHRSAKNRRCPNNTGHEIRWQAWATRGAFLAKIASDFPHTFAVKWVQVRKT